jgi:hypothetical protein
MTRFPCLILIMAFLVGPATFSLVLVAAPVAAQDELEPSGTLTPTPDIESPQTGAEEVESVTVVVKIFEGVQNKDWMLVTCASILIIVWVWNAFVMPRLVGNDKYPKWKKASPWISIGIGVVVQFTSAIIAGNQWTDALNTAVMTGLAASGGWSAIGKHTLGRVEKKLNGSTTTPPVPSP